MTWRLVILVAVLLSSRCDAQDCSQLACAVIDPVLPVINVTAPSTSNIHVAALCHPEVRPFYLSTSTAAIPLQVDMLSNSSSFADNCTRWEFAFLAHTFNNLGGTDSAVFSFLAGNSTITATAALAVTRNETIPVTTSSSTVPTDTDYTVSHKKAVRSSSIGKTLTWSFTVVNEAIWIRPRVDITRTIVWNDTQPVILEGFHLPPECTSASSWDEEHAHYTLTLTMQPSEQLINQAYSFEVTIDDGGNTYFAPAWVSWTVFEGKDTKNVPSWLVLLLVFIFGVVMLLIARCWNAYRDRFVVRYSIAALSSRESTNADKTGYGAAGDDAASAA